MRRLGLVKRMIYKKITTCWQERPAKKAFRNIREHLEWIGIDTTNLSDKDIEEKMLKISETISKFGITAKEAVENLCSHNYAPPVDLKEENQIV